jgi:hypothetical protein
MFGDRNPRIENLEQAVDLVRERQETHRPKIVGGPAEMIGRRQHPRHPRGAHFAEFVAGRSVSRQGRTFPHIHKKSHGLIINNSRTLRIIRGDCLSSGVIQQCWMSIRSDGWAA